MLSNYNAYYVYANLVRTGEIVVKSDQINIKTWQSHYDGILNILRDGIETEFVQRLFITVDYGNNEYVRLSIMDYYVNLLLWYSIVALNDQPLGPQHLFFPQNITRKNLKKYEDEHFVIPHKDNTSNKIINNVIADSMFHYIDLDEFSMFLANTLNLEDSVELMTKCPGYYQVLHSDLSNVPLEEVKRKGMELVDQAKKYIMVSEQYIGHDHCLKNPFAAGEGINAKQYKDNSINIGTKPDGQGSIYHEIINKSYITGGLNDLMSQYIDSASARVAQIISKNNIGDSGGFARILGLNNIDTFLYPDQNYDCGTNNYLEQFIPNKEVFDMLVGKFYKTSKNSRLLLITSKDTHLIGQTILLRSPIFCASHAEGKGICYHCYGKLARTNYDINIGRIATEILTAQYIQMRLSAKHQLEAKIKAILWNDSFHQLFNVNINTVELNGSIPAKELVGWKLIMDFESIQLESNEDFYKHDFYMGDTNSMNDNPIYNEYVSEFKVIDPNGNEYEITGDVDDDMDNSITKSVKMYITSSLREVIRNNVNIEDDSDVIEINMNELRDIPIFLIKMENNDLGRSLDEFVDLINKNAVTKKFSVHNLMQKIQLSIIKGNINITSVHLELIISNQIRNANDRMMMPNWRNMNEPYELITLNDALSDSRSPIIAATYRKLTRALTHPLSFIKFGPSTFDPFFMRKPKRMLSVDHEVLDIPDQKQCEPGECPVVYVHDHSTGRTPINAREFIKPFSPKPLTRLED